MRSFRAYGALAAVLLGAAIVAPHSLAGTFAPTLVVTTDADSGIGSLREAINTANSTDGPENITFNIPGAGYHRIQLLSPLPYIDDSVTIDGFTQPDRTGPATTPLIEISGTNVRDDSGLVIRTDGTKIRGLIITGFGHNGVAMLSDLAFNNLIQDCYIGVDISGTVAQGNGGAEGTQPGVLISGGASGNLIQNCLISGNLDGGITIEGGTANKVVGNRIGTDVNGVERVPNNSQGVLLQGKTSSNSIQNNLISGNDGDGIHLFNASDNFIFGNTIGANLACDQALENRGVGIFLTDDQNATSDNTIGNRFTGGGNLISGNFRDGIRIEGLGVTTTLIQGNRIGTDGTGTSIVANGDGGVAIINSAGHQVGGPILDTFRAGPSSKGTKAAIGASGRFSRSSVDPPASLGVANLLSGNGDDGVFIFGQLSTNNLVSENLIGTTIDGSAPLANNASGIDIRGSSENNVTYNTVSGNAVSGIHLEQGASSNYVNSNRVGTDPAGDQQVGGAGPGFLIETNSLSNVITENVVSGNGGDGVLLRSGANENRFFFNLVGLNLNGAYAIPNNGSGFQIGSSANEIGGGEGGTNLISGNRLDGITLSGADAYDNSILANYIGADASGNNPVPNQRHGVSLTSGAYNDSIIFNRIAYNLQSGVSVTGGSGNLIRYNSIFENGRLGIDLNEDAITFNDPGDLDAGSNGLQNYPVITDVFGDDESYNISGYLESEPSKTYLIDAYLNTSSDPSGHGEGESHLEYTEVTTDGSGHADFTINIGSALPEDVAISTTATASDGSTSEFSQNYGLGIDVTPPVITDCDVSPRNLPSTGGSVTIAAQVFDTESGIAQVSGFVTTPSGSTVEVILDPVPDSDYWVGTYNAPANTGSVSQNYAVKVEALDFSGNRAAADCGTFTVAFADNTPPNITNCTVTPRSLPSYGGYVMFQADVTDRSGILKVQAVVTNPNSTETRVTLLAPDSSDTYQGTYMLPGNLGTTDLTYGVRFEATDNAGNLATAPCGTFTVTAPDRTGPTFANCEVIPRTLPSSGGTVTIRADITDPSGVADATAFVTYPNSSVASVPITRQGNSNTYMATFTAAPNAALNAVTYAVKIAATDARENGATTDCGTFTVGGADATPPVIVSCQHTPTVLPPAGGAVTIDAVVTDNVGVRSVQARVSRPDGTVALVTLQHGTGNNYSGTYPAPANTGTSDQTYTVFVVAIDGGNNTTVARCGTFVVLSPDTQAPTISACQVQPRRLPSAGGGFTITATVTDNRSVASVVAHVTGPSGTTDVTLTGSADNYTGTFMAPANPSAQDVNYQVTLTATDSSGNPATASCGTATVLKPDAELPVIVSCNVLPRTLLASGGPVSITADVTDNAGVDRVEALVEIPDVFATVVTLSPKGANSFSGTWTAPANDTPNPRVYRVTIRAVDTSGNEATADCGTVTVAPPDNTDPVISACQVTPRALLARGGAVTITATVTDDVAVSSVRALITLPGGGQVPVTLTSQGGNNYQGNYAVAPNSSDTPQVYSVVISAQDNSGNPATADCGTFTVAVADTTPPVVTNCVVTPRAVTAAGGTVTVTADVTDNVSVQSVVAELRGPSGTSTVQLTPSGGSGYSGNLSLPANNTNSPVYYRVWLVASDPTGNQTTEDCGVLTVEALDREAPQFTSCSLSPTSLPFTGGAVQVQASVTDNVRVASVQARILRNGVTIGTADLVSTGGTNFAGTFAALPNRTGAAQEYTVELIARDAGGNVTTAPCGTYTVQVDTVPPIILACDATPREIPAGGGQVTFTATVTDAIPLDHVTAVITRTDGTTLQVELASIGQDQFRGTWNVPANATAEAQFFTASIIAADIAGNVSSDDCGSLTVALEDGGTAQLSAKQIAFGRVRFGTRVRRQFVIRNLHHGSRLSVNLSTLSIPFKVFLEGTGLGSASAASAKGKQGAVAAPGTGASFSIGPGGIVTVTVEFAPPGIRNYTDRLLVTTSDPRHREFRLRVSGVGCKNGRRGTPIGGDVGGGSIHTAAAARKKR